MMARGQKIVEASIATSVRQRMLEKASHAAALFEARWTRDALLSVDAELHAALIEQIELFHGTLVTGDDNEIVAHGEATVRGWHKAIVTMEQAGVADDAYLVGTFGEVTVVIGRSREPPQHLKDKHGASLVWLTPRECASLFFQVREVEAVKALWPAAEIVGVRDKADP